MSAGWVFVPSQQWVRICQTVAPFGFVYVWTQNADSVPPPQVSYRVYSAASPFYHEGSARFFMPTPLVVSLPSPYVEVWINSPRDEFMRVT
ncbi:hypothetical protein [Piscinibacter terrae]|uniref:hypothetical protein n=1 Tax=Piscinibacter terrae TaxID=2496871 RepID=UPI000F598EAA|nr:hypothetical protein [Albitalea terrae]